MREITGDDRYETELARSRTAPLSSVFRETIERPFRMLVNEPICVLFSLYISMVHLEFSFSSRELTWMLNRSSKSTRSGAAEAETPC